MKSLWRRVITSERAHNNSARGVIGLNLTELLVAASVLGLLAMVLFPVFARESELPEAPEAGADMTEENVWATGDFPIQTIAPQMGWRGTEIAPEKWKPVEQPNLAEKLKQAAPLTLVDVAPGPQSVNSGHQPYMVPNSDGTWDMIYPHFGKYFSPQQMVIHDFGTGQTTSQLLGTRKGDTLLTKGRWEFHMAPAYYSNGKLLLANQPYEPVMFAIYDPDQNRFTHAVRPFGETVVRGETVLGEDGKLYGIGWNKKEKDGFIAYWYDPASGQSWRSEVFGPANKNIDSLYGGTTRSGDWVYADYGRKPWHLVGFNFKTGEGRILATSQNIIGSYKTIRYTPIEGGLSGVIEQPATINGGDKVTTETLSFWVHEGKLIPRAEGEENTPWSGRPAVPIKRPSFRWARSGQHWPAGFKPQEMTPQQLIANSPDVLVLASEAKLSVKDPAKPGWKKVDGEKIYGGVALQNDGAPDKKARHNGVATVLVTFSEPGEYYLYFRGRSLQGQINAGMAFSPGDKDAKPFGPVTVDNNSRVTAEYGWRKAFQSLHNSNSFRYTVRKEDVGKPLEFKVASGYTGAYKKFPGMTWDALLFSKDADKVTSLLPFVHRDSEKVDVNGHAELFYQYQNGPLQTVKYNLTMRNVAMKMVTEINDHVLFALADEYGQQIFYNLKTQQVMRFDKASSPYSMGLASGKLYVSGYPGSQMFEYAFTDKDGRMLNRPIRTRVAQIDKANTTHNPMAGTLGGADGGIYNAGVTYGRQREGGGFGWYDPETGKIDGVPLDERLFWATSANNGRYIIFSGKAGASKDYHQLLGWDTRTHSFAYRQYVPDFGSAGPLVEALPGGLVMGHASAGEHGYLYGLDAATGKILWRKRVPDNPTTSFAMIRRHRYTFRRGPEGDIWTFLGDTLVRIDPRTAHITPLGRLPKGTSPAQIAFAQGNVYIAWGGMLRQIKGLRTGQLSAASPASPKNPEEVSFVKK